MQAYEFTSVVKNGIIHIPEQYQAKLPGQIKVILLAPESTPSQKEKQFTAITLKTTGFKFNRDEANER
jgi:hypothetical protein